jgi:hydroxymethylpyrimidine/phosphomethylpyrimidine kinase
VMVATSGDPLLEPEAIDVLARELVPRARIVTPNVPEAELLTGREIRSEADLREAARRLVEMGAAAALAKGGHLDGAEIVDVLRDGEIERVWRSPRIPRADTHGTGCTLSAAVAAGLALGRPLADAVGDAIAYTGRAIERAPGLGGGRGPVGHRAAGSAGVLRSLPETGAPLPSSG